MMITDDDKIRASDDKIRDDDDKMRADDSIMIAAYDKMRAVDAMMRADDAIMRVKKNQLSLTSRNKKNVTSYVDGSSVLPKRLSTENILQPTRSLYAV